MESSEQAGEPKAGTLVELGDLPGPSREALKESWDSAVPRPLPPPNLQPPLPTRPVQSHPLLRLALNQIRPWVRANLPSPPMEKAEGLDGGPDRRNGV